VSRQDAGFEVDANAVTIVSAAETIEVPLQSKAQVAGRILDAVEAWIARLPAPAGAAAE